jgi:hypothetical protein
LELAYNSPWAILFWSRANFIGASISNPPCTASSGMVSWAFRALWIFI